jgi:hypothetical protein
MVKFLLYIGLALAGMGYSLAQPVIGGVTCILAYLFNPVALAIDNHGFRYQLWTTIAVIVGIGLHRSKGAPRVGWEGMVTKLLWGFVTIALASSAWAEYSSQQALDTGVELLKSVVTATLLIRVIESRRDMELLILACLVGSLHAAFMYVFGARFGYLPTSDIHAVNVLPDAYSGVIVLLLPLAVVLGIFSRKKWERRLALLAIPLMFDSMINTYERAAFTALIVQIFFFASFMPKRRVLVHGPIFVVCMALLFWRFAPPDYWDRIATILSPHEEGSAASRFVINEASLAMFLDHPLGVGYGNYPDVSPRYLPKEYLTEGKRSAHNMYFTVLCETGILGFTCWISSVLGAVWLLRRIRKKAKGRSLQQIEIYAMGAELGLYGWMAQGWTQAFHEADPAFWWLVFAVALTRLQAKECESDEIKPEKLEEAPVAG